MQTDKRQWRFYTRLVTGDGHVSEHWCWDRLDAARQIVGTGAGFTTLPAALRDARNHGFTGDPKAWDQVIVPRRIDDWGADDAHDLQRWLIQRLPELDEVEQ